MTEIQKQSTAIQESLVAEINHYHAKCEEAAGQAVAYAKEAGDRLTKVKDSLGHGEWLPWLEKNFKGTPRTAQAYMRIANNWTELTKYETASHLSIRSALKELTAPKEQEPAQDGEEEEVTDEQLVEILRLVMKAVGPKDLNRVEEAAFEERLKEPGERERRLLDDLARAEHWMTMSMVARNGWLLSDDGEGNGVLCWVGGSWPEWGEVPKEERKLCTVRIPKPHQRIHERLRERIERGAKVYATNEFKEWRLVSDWFAEVLARTVADEDLEAVAGRIELSADWKVADLAGDYLMERLCYEAVFEKPLDVGKWVLRHGAGSLSEFNDKVGAVEVWCGIQQRHLIKSLMEVQEN